MKTELEEPTQVARNLAAATADIQELNNRADRSAERLARNRFNVSGPGGVQAKASPHRSTPFSAEI
ncbi:MAG TPA: hypothetical protein VEJ84_17105 [Acidimicrobiales bacterium]|nr:hypothetical protein [Acidimicrobiales bacterium]